ncbi:hypothetical protein D3C86_496100 [compost metagenome]
MKLTRAIPAVLALSMLTGCDMNAFLPKNPDGKNTIQDPGTNIANKLSDAELKSVAAFKGGLVDAAGQGLAAAGTVNALKSVAALRSVSAYRTASITGFPDGGTSGISWENPYTSENNQFTGKKGAGKLNDLDGWYLDGTFTLIKDFTATGQAMFQASGNGIDPNKLDEYQASAKVDILVTQVPADAPTELANLKDSQIYLELNKVAGASTVLEGEFKITKNSVEAKGTLEIELLANTWKVVVPSVDDENKQVFISLTRDANGAGAGRVYGAKDGKADYDTVKAEFSWGSDGKVKLNGKATDVVLTF